MVRVSLNKLTGKLIEMQSGGYDIIFPAGMSEQEKAAYLEQHRQNNLNIMIQNAVNCGANAEEVEAKFVTEEEYSVIYAEATRPEREAREAIITARAQDIASALPTWAQAEAAIDGVSNLAEAKAILKKLARVVYWLAKNAED